MIQVCSQPGKRPKKWQDFGTTVLCGLLNIHRCADRLYSSGSLDALVNKPHSLGYFTAASLKVGANQQMFHYLHRHMAYNQTVLMATADSSPILNFARSILTNDTIPHMVISIHDEVKIYETFIRIVLGPSLIIRVACCD